MPFLLGEWIVTSVMELEKMKRSDLFYLLGGVFLVVQKIVTMYL
jgi:hypothetical protein